MIAADTFCTSMKQPGTPLKRETLMTPPTSSLHLRADRRHAYRLACLVWALTLVSSVGSSVDAATYYWDTNGVTAGFGTASGTWDTAPSGSAFFSTSSAGTATTTTATTTTADSLNFGSATNGLNPGTVTVSGNQTINNLTSSVQSGNITLSGGTINLGGTSPSLTDTHTDAAATAFTISSQLAGSDGLTKLGTGRVILSGSNTYSGATVVDAGVLQANSSTAFGNTSGISLTAKAAGTGTAAGTALQLANGVTINKSITLNSVNVGTLRTALVSFSGNNEWSGGVTLQGDGLTRFNLFNNTTGNLTVSGSITGASYTGTLVLGGNTVGNFITGTLSLNGTATIQKADPGTWTISSTGNAWGVTFLSQDTLVLGAHDALATSARFDQGSGTSNSTLMLNGFNQTVGGLSNRSGNLTFTSTRRIVNGNVTPSTFTVNQSGDSTYTGILGGPGTHENNFSLVKTGAGVLTLTGVNTYTGNTSIDGGTLTLGSSGSMANSGTIKVANGATFNVSAVTGGWTLGGNQTLGGSGTILGNVTFSGNSSFNVSDIIASGTPLSMASGSIITFGSGFGIANLTGVVNWDALNLSTPYTLISTNQTFTSGDIANFGLANAAPVGTGRFAYFQNGSLQLVVVPEPSTIVLVGLSCAAVGLIARRRRLK